MNKSRNKSKKDKCKKIALAQCEIHEWMIKNYDTFLIWLIEM